MKQRLYAVLVLVIVSAVIPVMYATWLLSVNQLLSLVVGVTMLVAATSIAGYGSEYGEP